MNIPVDIQERIRKTLLLHPNAKPDHQRTVKHYSKGVTVVRTLYQLREGDQVYQELDVQFIYD